MSENELVALMDKLHIRRTTVAKWIGYTPEGVHQWQCNRIAAPRRLIEWLIRLDAWMGENPPPSKKQMRE